MKNVLIVLSGPSGVGKGTIAKELVKRNKFDLSISCTTREPRIGEVDGRDYFFISKTDFEKKISENGFLEYSEHFENYYGTPKDFVLEKLKNNNVILEIDVNGGLNVRNNFKDAVLILIMPPSIEEVKNRLLKRNTENIDKINERIARIDYEVEKGKSYDYKVINDNLEVCINEIERIIEKENLQS